MHLGAVGGHNLAPNFLRGISERLKLAQDQATGLPKGISPEDIFHYVYAILYSQEYRTRYAEFLKIEHPRFPLTADRHLFQALADLGAELVSLHLLKAPSLETPITDWQVTGDNEV